MLRRVKAYLDEVCELDDTMAPLVVLTLVPRLRSALIRPHDDDARRAGGIGQFLVIGDQLVRTNA